MPPQQSLNLNVRGLGRSPTLAINERSNRLTRQGATVFKFGLGQSPFPVPDPLVEALRLHAPEKDYLPVEGLEALRLAISGYYRRQGLGQLMPEGVLIGPGSKELMFLLMLAYYGDVVVPAPCWVSYGPQARIIGRQIRVIPTTSAQRWRLDAEQLDAFCSKDPGRPRLVVLNYPGNPDGGTYAPDALRALAEVARRHDVILLSDEIYGELHHQGHHTSIAALYPEGTIVSSGISKWCGAGGWRLGTFSFPAELSWLREAMAIVASETYTSVSAPIQYAAVRAFQGGLQLERYLRHTRRILALLGNAVADILRAGGVEVNPPEGGFYLFLDFAPLAPRLAARGILNGPDLAERLLTEAGVALLPGSAFEQTTEALTARLAYVDFDGARALAASEAQGIDTPLNESFLERHCSRVLAGARAITTWLD